MTIMLASKDIVRKLIPQGAPMAMVDTLIKHDVLKTISGFFIEADNLFAEEGYFTEEGLIENIAQTAALRTAWTAMTKEGETDKFVPPAGVIGSIRQFKIYRKPAINTWIETEITLITEIFNASVITGKVMQGDELLAEGELKIFLQE